MPQAVKKTKPAIELQNKKQRECDKNRKPSENNLCYNKTIMKRIIDVNLNRTAEGLRILEEISRFVLNNRDFSSFIKKTRHKICQIQEADYQNLLKARDSLNDIGPKIQNPDSRVDIETIFKANVKRIQQSLRVLEEYDINNSSVYEKLRYQIYDFEKKMWSALKLDLKKYLLNNRNLYLVTNSDGFESDDKFLDAVAQVLSGGVDIIQLREKKSNARRIIELGHKIRQLTSIYNALFIVNDRVDIAKIVKADGVHLGQDDVEIDYAKEILGSDKIIGISTHERKQAIKAVEQGADYIGVGPVFETPTKPGRKSVGLDYVKWASENVIDIPFYAIGGINQENVRDVIEFGAKNIAVVRAIINATSPKEATIKFKECLNGNIINA